LGRLGCSDSENPTPGRVFKLLDPPRPPLKRGEKEAQSPLIKGDLAGRIYGRQINSVKQVSPLNESIAKGQVQRGFNARRFPFITINPPCLLRGI
jgi:hypothetical protein